MGVVDKPFLKVTIREIFADNFATEFANDLIHGVFPSGFCLASLLGMALLSGSCLRCE
jgi:hypothetical protein